MKELDEKSLDSIVGGIAVNNSNAGNEEKWAKVGIRIAHVNGFAEYYLIKDGTRISPKKALEIYTSMGGKI